VQALLRRTGNKTTATAMRLNLKEQLRAIFQIFSGSEPMRPKLSEVPVRMVS
jgi:hypothetical protein